MKISREISSVDEKIVLCQLEGDLDISGCNELDAELSSILEAGKFFVMAIMEKVTDISSPFIGKLIECRQQLINKGGNLVIVGLPPDLKKGMLLMGIDKIFSFYNDAHLAYNRFHWDYVETAHPLKLTFPPKLECVPAVRLLISGIAKQKGYSAKDSFRIETIADEIANNAIEHGDATQTEIGLEFYIDRNRIELSIKNKTHLDKADNLKYIINSNKRSSVDEKTFGRGLAMVKLISNSINVAVDNTGTYVKVTKTKEKD
ncbi:MAG: ATP-binding protein [Fibrobacteria bacterium]|nr:ATP-binding protein [Fibrobacteria bacterium]